MSRRQSRRLQPCHSLQPARVGLNWTEPWGRMTELWCVQTAKVAVAFQALPFASALLSSTLPAYHRPPAQHNEPHKRPSLAHPRLATNTAHPHRPPAHLARAVCFTAAQPSPHATNTAATPRRPLPQHRAHQHPRPQASHRPRLNPRGRRQIRQRCHCRAQSPAALLRHDLHLQEVPRPLVASHHQAGLPLWHRAG